MAQRYAAAVIRPLNNDPICHAAPLIDLVDAPGCSGRATVVSRHHMPAGSKRALGFMSSIGVAMPWMPAAWTAR